MTQTETIPPGAGDARITWYAAGPGARFVVALGHGAGGGIEARDLQARAQIPVGAPRRPREYARVAASAW
ncbi:hypothetical protein ACE14D_26335, partial [Streptomyces sp. Act-28]